MGIGKVILGVGIGVGAIAAAPFTGGGSVVGAVGLASSLAGASAAAVTAGAAGGTIGALASKKKTENTFQPKIDDNELRFMILLGIASGFSDGNYLGTDSDSSELDVIKGYIKDLPEKFQNEINEYILGKKTLTLEKLRSSYSSIKEKQDSKYDEIVENVIKADGDVYPSEKAFQYHWEFIKENDTAMPLYYSVTQFDESCRKVPKEILQYKTIDEINREYPNTNSVTPNNFYICHPSGDKELILLSEAMNHDFIYDKDWEFIEVMRNLGATQVEIIKSDKSNLELSLDNQFEASGKKENIEITASGSANGSFLKNLEQGKKIVVRFVEGKRSLFTSKKSILNKTIWFKNDPACVAMLEGRIGRGNKMKEVFVTLDYSQIVKCTLSLNATMKLDFLDVIKAGGGHSSSTIINTTKNQVANIKVIF